MAGKTTTAVAKPRPDSGELAALASLRTIVEEGLVLCGDAATPPGQATTGEPPFAEVMSALGYLVALQHTPSLAGSLSPGDHAKMLVPLVQVIEAWTRGTQPTLKPAYLEMTQRHLHQLRGPTVPATTANKRRREGNP